MGEVSKIKIPCPPDDTFSYSWEPLKVTSCPTRGLIAGTLADGGEQQPRTPLTMGGVSKKIT